MKLLNGSQHAYIQEMISEERLLLPLIFGYPTKYKAAVRSQVKKLPESETMDMRCDLDRRSGA